MKLTDYDMIVFRQMAQETLREKAMNSAVLVAILALIGFLYWNLREDLASLMVSNLAKGLVVFVVINVVFLLAINFVHIRRLTKNIKNIDAQLTSNL